MSNFEILAHDRAPAKGWTRGRQPVDLRGQRFGRLIAETIVKRTDKGRHAYWSCRCDCGKTVCVRGTGLRDGMHKSCGCWRIEASRDRALSFKEQGHNRFGILFVPKSPALVRASSLGRRVPLAYPYLGAGSIHSDDLLTAVNRAVPRGLPEHIRADACQEMIADILDGSLAASDITAAAMRYVRRAYGDRFKMVSLDAPIQGTESLRLLDVIEDSRPHF